MPSSVLEMPRPIREGLQRVVKKSREVNHVRRALGLLTLHALGGNLSAASQVYGASRRALRQWRKLYEAGGERAIEPKPRGREDWKATEELLRQLSELVRTDPTGPVYLRSRWSSELLALELKRRGAVQVHATTFRRWRARLSIVWRRARPTLHIADPRKQRKMQAIRQALQRASPREEVFCVDEADIDLNPRIGASRSLRGQQATVPTPGKNRKCYVPGALNARTGKVIWAEHTRKDTGLFLRLLQALLSAYRRARPLRLIVVKVIMRIVCSFRGDTCFVLKIRAAFPGVGRWTQNKTSAIDNRSDMLKRLCRAALASFRAAGADLTRGAGLRRRNDDSVSSSSEPTGTIVVLISGSPVTADLKWTH